MVLSQKASLEWMEMIDGDVGKGSTMVEVWRVAVLPRPQLRKLGHHGRVLIRSYARVRASR